MNVGVLPTSLARERVLSAGVVGSDGIAETLGGTLNPASNLKHKELRWISYEGRMLNP
jgi:hypothetical protein